jgi:hypothetical protein
MFVFGAVSKHKAQVLLEECVLDAAMCIEVSQM